MGRSIHEEHCHQLSRHEGSKDSDFRAAINRKSSERTGSQADFCEEGSFFCGDHDDGDSATQASNQAKEKNRVPNDPVGR